MHTDLFKFWNVTANKIQFSNGKFAHPADRDVLQRVKHKFDLRCLPGCFSGPLKTAPIVLLYLSPGLSKQDRKNAQSLLKRKRYANKQYGRSPLPGPDNHYDGWKWWKDRTKVFGIDWKLLQDKVAIFNIGAYHSRTLADTSVIAALPSSRVSLDWAQNVLFPAAIGGRRIVICMRAARFWGLRAGKRGRRYGKSLYVPAVVRSGYMAKRQLRGEIITAVCDIINKANSHKRAR